MPTKKSRTVQGSASRRDVVQFCAQAPIVVNNKPSTVLFELIETGESYCGIEASKKDLYILLIKGRLVLVSDVIKSLLRTVVSKQLRPFILIPDDL